jgi:hypothetical protein
MDKVIFNCRTGDNTKLEIGRLGGGTDDEYAGAWIRTSGGRPVHLSTDQIVDLLGVLDGWK